MQEFDVAVIRRHARHCLRYMEGYRVGLKGPLLDYAMKKYTSHRTIQAEHIELIEREYGEVLIKKEQKWGSKFLITQNQVV